VDSVCFYSYAAVLMGWREDVGRQLLLRREIEKRWNRSRAAQEADLSPGTIENIELARNVETESIEKYAAALGLELVIKLEETQRPTGTTGGGTAGKPF
jgi:hypothetical protein